MSLLDAEKRLGFEMQSLNSIISATAKDSVGDEMLKDMKERVYCNIVDYLGFEGYPSESTVDFSVSDLVFAIISPILSGFRRKVVRDIRLRREKEIVSMDGETGGKEEFVVIDVVSLTERNYVLVIEGKKSARGEAMKQCLLSMKDIRDNNGYGEVYGFIMTGESWKMFQYDGQSFRATRKIDVLFEDMCDEELWMKENTVLVDCFIVALSSGGIVKKDVVVG
ncbi:hypothetical protein BDZ91DRAFT_815912 [Kalaharituber pfeilii]|nr:hypothetical protein BDZ91DRAFT_815912 [Kalaharituber pfeilii]